MEIKKTIEEIVNRETRAWDTQDVDLLLSIIHPDMVWPWPSHENAHDPIDWVWGMGRFNKDRWQKVWQDLFDTHTLIHNKRSIQKISLSPENDGAFAVVDIDTLWRNNKTKADFIWKGRVCKIYAKMGTEWKMTAHTGVLKYK